MSFNFVEHSAGRVREIQVSDRLSRDVYHAFLPNSASGEHSCERVHMLVILRNFQGWKAGALWEDLRTNVKHHPHVQRLAIVGDSKWQDGMQVFCKPFSSATIQFFDIEDVAAAREWIQSDLIVAM